MLTRNAVVLTLCVGFTASAALAGRAEDRAAKILRATGVTGGLVVHLGCGDGELTAQLCAGESYLVHGLDVDATNVAAARAHIRSKGLYGRASVERLGGARLPYVDNLVNLVVTEELGDVPMAEVLRVLAPRGVAYVRRKGGWQKTVKPWPRDIDEWTHYLHGADNNPVSRDERVGPPNQMRWVAAPRRSRSHEYAPSLAAMVSAGGRLFCIQDEGVRGILDSRIGDRWTLHARDAFNGLPLWSRPVPGWGGGEWKDRSHWGVPMSLPRRLVSDGARAYATLGYRAPVTELDARTGKVIRVHQTTARAEELILTEGVLLVRRRREVPDYHPEATPWKVQVPRQPGKSRGGDNRMREPLGAKTQRRAAPPSRQPAPADEAIVAIRTKDGKALWTWPETRIVTLSLAARNGRVCYHNFEELVCLDLATGKELWRRKSPSWPDLVGTAGTVVMAGDLVFLADDRGVQAWAADSGRRLWKGRRILRSAPRQPSELFVAGGLLWGSLTPQMPTGTVPKEQSPFAVEPMSGTEVQGLDPQTGQIRKSIDIAALISHGHHIRCYRGKATERFLIWVKRGMEFVDIEKGTRHERCDWVRGGCSYGLMPANGLIYAPPHSCICDEGVGLNGFNALAAGYRQREPEEDSRLRRGPAYGDAREKTAIGGWPTYRRDAARSGSTGASVPARLTALWSVRPGRRLTPPVFDEERLYVASPDTHTVHALSKKDGRLQWTFTADGPVDSPPTLHEGLALFGCRDGRVYALRARDGALVWRFRAAPREERIVARGRVESPWPVPGSILVVKGSAYFVAGRSSFLDGGMDLFAVDPHTGKVLHRIHLDGPRPDLRKDLGRPFDMEGWKPDILTSDGERVFLFFHEFGLDLKTCHTPAPQTRAGRRRGRLHLMATGGFLDDDWHDRTFWSYSHCWQGRYFGSPLPGAGQILSFDETTTYALQAFPERNFMSPGFLPGRKGYRLVADENEKSPGAKRRRRWAVRLPVRARAMVLAGETIFLAGPPDIVPARDPAAAFEGRLKAKLWSVSARDGSRIARMDLDAAPVFDGMVADEGALYVVSRDGKVIRLGKGP